jgi:hypothetical protein
LRDVTTAQSQLIPEQYVQNKIDLLTANKAKWSLILRQNKKKTVGGWAYYILEDLLIKRKTTLASTAAVAAVTWNLAAGTGAYVAGWDILWNRTRNVFVHAEARTDDAITVIANIDSGTDVQGEVGDEIIIMSNTTQEAGGLTLSKTTQETRRTNYVMDMLTPLSFSDMAALSDYVMDGKDINHQRMKMAIEHQRSMYLSSMLGPLAAKITSIGTNYENPVENAYPFAMSESYRAFLNARADTNHIRTDTDLTEQEFVRNMRYAWEGEDEGEIDETPVLFCGHALTMEAFPKWNLSRQTFEKMQSKSEARLGMKYTKWVSQAGDVDIVYLPELDSSISGGQNFYFFTRRSKIGYVAYNGMDTHFTDLKPDQDNPKTRAQYLRTVFGTYFTQANAHVFGKFVTSS